MEINELIKRLLLSLILAIVFATFLQIMFTWWLLPVTLVPIFYIVWRLSELDSKHKQTSEVYYHDIRNEFYDIDQAKVVKSKNNPNTVKKKA